jgi:hypothetical protein
MLVHPPQGKQQALLNVGSILPWKIQNCPNPYTLVTCRLNLDLLLVVSDILRHRAAPYVAAGCDPDRSMIGGYNLN